MGPIILAQASVLGRRHEKNGLDNQDRLFCCRLGTGCFIGCWDGISAFGERGGEAARIAADITRQTLSNLETIPTDARSFLIGLVRTIQGAIMDRQPKDGPVIGTTMTACLIDTSEHLLHVVHIGNSPVLITQCGADLHKITKDDIDRFNAGALTRWLGSGSGVDDNTLYSCTKLEANDVIVLCTDGVAHAFNGREQEMESVIKQSRTIEEMEETARALVEYAHEHSLDDVSIICVKLNGQIEGAITPKAKETARKEGSTPPGLYDIKLEKTDNRHRIFSLLVAFLIGILTGYSIALIAGRNTGRVPALQELKEATSHPSADGDFLIDSISFSPYNIPTDSL